MKKIAIILFSMLLMVSGVQAQEISDSQFKKVSISSIDVLNVKVYDNKYNNEKVILEGFIQLKKDEKSDLNKITYTDAITKTNISIKDTFINTNDLNLKGKLREDGTLILNALEKDFSLDDKARANLEDIKDLLKVYNDKEKFHINYANIDVKVILTSIADNFNLYYTLDDQVIISREMMKKPNIKINNESATKKLYEFFDRDNISTLYREYYIPFEIIIERE